MLCDDEGCFYVDVFLLMYFDVDYCRGFEKYFYFGLFDEWKKVDDKIVICEMWFLLIIFWWVFCYYNFCVDVKVWVVEVCCRVCEFWVNGYVYDGDWVKILGEDVDGKIDDLMEILVVGGDVF